MGGGVSCAAAEQMEEMMAYSVLLGRTITCMSFPGTVPNLRARRHMKREHKSGKTCSARKLELENTGVAPLFPLCIRAFALFKKKYVPI